MKKCDYIGFKIINNLMAPIFEIGDIVFLDKNEVPKNGEYGGFILNGRSYICGYKEKNGERYLLFKESKKKIKSIDSFEIIGRVKSKHFEI